MINVHEVFRSKCVEPVKRNKDGLRWIVHRFPIKGGISLRDAMMIDLYQLRPSAWDKVLKRAA
jgi:hypothetical protein